MTLTGKHMVSHGENESLVERIRYWGRTKPGELALRFLADGENESCRLSFGELDDQAHRLSGRMIRADLAGQPVLLMAQSGPEFVLAFCGCLYAGVIAVPSPFIFRNRGQDRIRSIAKDAGTVAVIAGNHATTESLQDIIPDVPSVPIEGLHRERALLGSEDPNKPALLQYTSGSTGAPKGVVVSHRNLMANIAMLSKAVHVHPGSHFLTWLPLFHDMGLIGHVLAALYCGVPCTMMPPLTFLQKPRRWLDAISRYQATISAGPNFAYELCVRRLGQRPLGQLNLSTWEAAVCASEPVRLSTMRRFARVFGAAGFRERALYPCYGLAEATVFVTGGIPGEGLRISPLDVSSEPSLVSCGRPPRGGSVTIVDPDRSEEVPDGMKGEIWVCGDHVAAGYWKNSVATAGTFGATLPGHRESFLRTGDLGFKWQGDLYVTGRRKNLIIYRGVNLHPEDIESTVGACHPGFGISGAAFSIEANDEEQVVVAYEMGNESLAHLDTRAIIGSALDVVAREHGVRLFDLVLLRPGTLPRTTSGKVQRNDCRRLYLSGELTRTAHPTHHPSLGRYQTVADGRSEPAAFNINR